MMCTRQKIFYITVFYKKPNLKQMSSSSTGSKRSSAASVSSVGSAATVKGWSEPQKLFFISFGRGFGNEELDESYSTEGTPFSMDNRIRFEIVFKQQWSTIKKRKDSDWRGKISFDEFILSLKFRSFSEEHMLEELLPQKELSEEEKQKVKKVYKNIDGWTVTLTQIKGKKFSVDIEYEKKKEVGFLYHSGVLKTIEYDKESKTFKENHQKIEDVYKIKVKGQKRRTEIIPRRRDPDGWNVRLDINKDVNEIVKRTDGVSSAFPVTGDIVLNRLKIWKLFK